ncbi:MAG: DnaD domain protein [Lachnospiraceae bacterium]|nr:DnaD domain protein [Lachnospiraceae bacterium]
MDSSITLSYGCRTTDTRISNKFIDNYMAEARGSDVKVYIYLLRCFQDPTLSVNISAMAEALDETEKDIRTALKYWDSKQIISVTCARNGRITNILIRDLDLDENGEDIEDEEDISVDTAVISVEKKASKTSQKEAPAEYAKDSTKTSSPKPAAAEKKEIERPNYSSEMISGFRNEYPDFDNLLDYIETALEKTLTHRDLQTPSFIFESLDFPAELIKFLYSHCVSLGKKSNAYIEKVAREWHNAGVRTVDDAKRQIEEFSNKYAAVKAAFGIKRSFGEAELNFLRRWYDELKMPEDLIREACSRTMLSISKPSFEYADSILSKWYEAGYKTRAEISNAANERKAAAAASKKQSVSPQLQFAQRSYSQEDFDEIERQKLGIVKKQ